MNPLLHRTPLLLALLLASPVAAAGSQQVCHQTGGGRMVPLAVAPAAVAAHLRHGDGAAVAWYRDADGDGFGDPGGQVFACARPEGHVAQASDCDDTRADVQPGAAEVCDGVDNDCDGQVDGDTAEDAGTWYTDADGDGFGDPGQWVVACVAPPGTTDDASDCDDGLAAVNPGAAESCTPYDDDCDGQVNEADAADATTWYADADGDGWGDPALAESACAQPAGTVGVAGDCDDGDGSVWPGAAEACDGIDDDCDGEVDEDAIDRLLYAPDDDGDGFGDASRAALSCQADTGAILLDLPDCDDGEAAVSPLALERCNGVDDDCDGTTDEPDAIDAPTWFADADGDGWGSSADAAGSCEQPSGYVALAGDCAADDDAVSPEALEVCNAVDDDCDGAVDNDPSCSGYEAVTSADPVDWFGAAEDCEARGMHLVTIGDADEITILEQFDAGPARYWIGAARPTWENDLAQVPGYAGEDWTWTTSEAWSFSAWAPGEPSQLPGEGCGAIELGGDGWLDLPCDDEVYSWICEDDGLQVTDADGDGWSWGGGDCDDRSPAFGPQVSEACDGFDDDCDGQVDEDYATVGDHWYVDADGDGWGVYDLAVHDCNGAPPAGFVATFGDCDDGDPGASPAQAETCDGRDDDCDGQVDEGCP